LSEYDPLFGEKDGAEAAAERDLATARELFGRAGRTYLSSPLPWIVWAGALPAAALLTPAALAYGGAPAVLLLWSVAILVGGAVEGAFILRQRRRMASSGLGSWAMGGQGNLSLAALVLSAALLWRELPQLLPGLWLLLLGHSLFLVGGLAFRPLRTAGLIYQLGGVVALAWPPLALEAFAAATAAGNLWVAWGLGVARPELRPR